MIVILLIVALLALVHFVFDGIVLPSIRWELRLRLFKLRDELRSLKINKQEELDDGVFSILQGVINNTSTLLYEFDLLTIGMARAAIAKDEGLKGRIEKRISIVDDCPLEEVDRIKAEVHRIARRALVWNSLVTFIYLVPVVVLLKVIVATGKIINTPENELKKIVPGIAASSSSQVHDAELIPA